MTRDYSEERFLNQLGRVATACDTYRHVLLQKVVAGGEGSFELGSGLVKVDERFLTEALGVLIVQLIDEAPFEFRHVLAVAGAKWAEELGLFDEDESPEGSVS